MSSTNDPEIVIFINNWRTFISAITHRWNWEPPMKIFVFLFWFRPSTKIIVFLFSLAMSWKIALSPLCKTFMCPRQISLSLSLFYYKVSGSHYWISFLIVMENCTQSSMYSIFKHFTLNKLYIQAYQKCVICFALQHFKYYYLLSHRAS